MAHAPASPNAPPAEWLVEQLAAARVLDAARVSPFLAEFRAAHPDGDAARLADFFVQSGVLTAYQAQRTLAGEAGRLVLGPYLLAGPVGSGSLGTVFQAVGRSDRKRYAVKVLPLRSLWNVRQAKKQLQLFAALPPHPVLLPFLDVDSAGGFHYLVWPFAEGETLDRLVVRAGPLAVSEAVRVMARVADGLAVCHAAGMVHGLLKPSNILIGADGDPRLLDLGMGAVLSDNLDESESMLDTISTANAAMGMLDCCPPETTLDPAVRTPAGDAYSFGCVLYYLLVGELPFPDGNAIEKVIAHQTRPPTPATASRPSVPGWLSALVDRLMAKDPAARPDGLAAVRDELLAGKAEGQSGAVALPKPRAVSSENLDLPFREAEVPVAAPTPVTGGTLPPLGSKAEDEVDFDAGSRPADEFDWSSRQSGRRPRAEPPAGPDPSAGGPPADAGKMPLDMFRSQLLPRQKPPPPAAGEGSSPLPDLPPPLTYTVPPPTAGTPGPAAAPPPPAARGRSLARRLRNSLLFWRTPTDLVQLSLFGPAQVSPGDSVTFSVYAHQPESFDSVRTLCRAFQRDGDLIAYGYLDREVARGTQVALHLAVANAGVAHPLMTVAWLGQPQPRAFEVHVPWESPPGSTPAVLSAGVNGVLAAKVPFRVMFLPRRG